jgi:hypothetical protein
MPNLVFRDGFDTYASVSGVDVGVASKWPTAASGTLVTGRFGTGQAANLTGASTDWITPTFTALSSFTFEAGFMVVAGTTGSIIFFREGATNHVDLTWEADGTIRAKRNGTLLGSSAGGAFTVGSWYSLQVEVVISDTVGRVTIYLDGVQKLNLTGLDTKNGGTGVVDRIYFSGGSGSIGGRYDDMLVQDSATRLANPIRASTLYPTSDGATLNLVPSTGTSHFALVDEALASRTDYLSGSTVGDLDLLGLGNLPTTPLSIQEVNAIVYASKTDATNRSIALGVKSGATTSDGSNYALSSSGGRFERPLAVDPNTGAAWTTSAVNALELQPKVTV